MRRAAAVATVATLCLLVARESAAPEMVERVAATALGLHAGRTLAPQSPRRMLAIMTERLEDFRSITPLLRNSEMSPKFLADELLYGMGYTELGHGEICYGCWCSRTNVLGALATLNRNEIQSMVDDGDVLEISCDYCTAEYRVTPAELLGLLDQN